MRIPLAFQSIFVGLVTSVVLFTLIGSLDSQPIAELWARPGIVVGTMLAAVLPSAWIYAIEPEGGPEGFFVLIGVGTLIAWWIVFAVGFHIWRRIRSRNSRGSVA